jgi:hypothetical protein
MPFQKEIRNSELYLWYNGHLIYKRWLETGESKVFDVMAYDKYTLCSITDLDLEASPELIHVQARFKMKTAAEGGRMTGFKSGYRPNHVFEYENGRPIGTFIGNIQFESQELILPGEETLVSVRFLMAMPIEKYLAIGRTWWIHEGARCVGELEMLGFELPE